MSQLLSIKNLNLAFGTKKIFDNAELTIQKGDKIGLIGLNGQGKSTLFNILIGKVRPDNSIPPYTFDTSNEPFEFFLIPQELNIKQFIHLSIDNYYLAFYPELYKLHLKIESDPGDAKNYEEFENLGGWDIQNNYVNYLKGFELRDLHRSVKNLSGGEQRKMALSIGLSSTAEFLLWDEPTNHLDIETIERFEDELINSNKTFFLITHDRYLLNHTTHRICHIERGKITNFKGTYLDYLVYLKEKEEELQKNLEKLENKHRRELAWMRQGIRARGTRSKKRVEGFENIQQGIANIKGRSKKVVDLGLLHSGRKSKILVSIKEGSFAYDDHIIFSELNLIVAKKDKIALIGPNGAGKSTLINIFQEKLSLSSGVQKNAEDLKVVVFDQNRESLDEEKTPKEIIGEGSEFIIFDDGRKQHINAYLANFLFTSDQVHRPVSTLSGGEKNRLQLAKFMKQSADLWVFDEPTNDLDIETIELLEREIRSYESAVIVIGHDRAFLDNTCKSTWLIHEQKVEVFEGGYTQVAPYLHAIELEKSLLQEAPPSKNKKNKSKTKNKQNMVSLESIEKEIHDKETALNLLEEDLSNFDYTSMNEAQKKKLDSMQSQIHQYKSSIEKLYQDWEQASQDS